MSLNHARQDRVRQRLDTLFMDLMTSQGVKIREVAQKLPIEKRLLQLLPSEGVPDATYGFALAEVLARNGVEIEPVCSALRREFPPAAPLISRTLDSLRLDGDGLDKASLKLLQTLSALGRPAPTRLLLTLLKCAPAELDRSLRVLSAAGRVIWDGDSARAPSSARWHAPADEVELHRGACVWYLDALRDVESRGLDPRSLLEALLHHQAGAGDLQGAQAAFERLRTHAPSALDDPQLQPTLERLCSANLDHTPKFRQQVQLLFARTLTTAGRRAMARELLESALTVAGDDKPGVLAELAMLSLDGAEPGSALHYALAGQVSRPGPDALAHPPFAPIIARARWEMHNNDGLYMAILEILRWPAPSVQWGRGLLLLVEPLLAHGDHQRAKDLAQEAHAIAVRERNLGLVTEALLCLARVAPSVSIERLLADTSRVGGSGAHIQGASALVFGGARPIDAARRHRLHELLQRSSSLPVALRLDLKLALGHALLAQHEAHQAFEIGEEVAVICLRSQSMRRAEQAQRLRAAAWTSMGKDGEPPAPLTRYVLADPADMTKTPSIVLTQPPSSESNQMAQTPYTLLSDLLLSMFSSVDLKHFLYRYQSTLPHAKALPDTLLGNSVYVNAAAIMILDKGLATSEFFDRLTQEVPGRTYDIESVEKELLTLGARTAPTGQSSQSPPQIERPIASASRSLENDVRTQDSLSVKREL